MKAKIYPLSTSKSIKIDVPPSQKLLHYEIICASIAKGTSIIKNVNYSKNILDTIEWCKQMGAVIRKEENRLIIHGINNQVHFANNVFETKNSSYTFLYMLPFLSLANQPIIFKTNNPSIIEKVMPYKHIYEKENLYFYIENNTIKIEQSIRSGFIYINGHGNTPLILGLLLALPLLHTSSKIVVRYPITNEEDIKQSITLLKKFGVIISLNTANHTIEIAPNQSFKAYSMNTECDYFMLSMFTILQGFEGNISLKNAAKKSESSDYLLLNYLKQMNIDLVKNFNYNFKKRKEIEMQKVDLSIHENAIPLFMPLALSSKKTVTFKNLDANNKKQQEQLKIMLNIFNTLDIEYKLEENDIVVFGKTIENKKQLDCQNNPYIAIAFSLLAIISKAPLIIKNCQCIDDIYANFYSLIQSFGSIVEFIHD